MGGFFGSARLGDRCLSCLQQMVFHNSDAMGRPICPSTDVTIVELTAPKIEGGPPPPIDCGLRCCVSVEKSPDECKFLVCDSVVTTRFRCAALLGEEFRVCPTHETALRRGERMGWTIKKSREGWLYLDNWLRYFFA